MRKVIGICSICGGNVVDRFPKMGKFDPILECEKCHVVKKRNLPVVQMEENNQSEKQFLLS